MSIEYKVVSEWLSFTSGQKARGMEKTLNQLSRDGWELVEVEPVMFLGFDVGYYLVLKRETSGPT